MKNQNISLLQSELKTTELSGLAITTASRTDLVRAMIQDCVYRRANPAVEPKLVFDINGHGLSLRETDPLYRQYLSVADIIHADGGFIVTASRYFGKDKIQGRSATTDMIHDFAKAAEINDISFFLLGGSEQVNVEASLKLRELYPNLNIAGRYHGFFDSSDEENIIQLINKANPDILWVGLGKPLEQAFAVKNRLRIKAGWVVTCGGCFNYVTGAYRRAPNWMQQYNLEWLHRMLTNPRLFKRYITTTPHALAIILSSHLLRKKASSFVSD